jgi:hypothetical protein
MIFKTDKFILLVGLAMLSGCQTPSSYTNLELPSEAEMSAFPRHPLNCDDGKAAADWRCDAPFVAKYKIDPDFKYGRFCGKGHPRIKTDAGAQIDGPENRKARAAEYFQAEPIDDIDKTCRDHDVCWAMNPRNLTECNMRFERTMSKLHDQFNKQIGFLDTDTPQWRCAVLANDMAFGSVFMKESSTASGRKFGANLVKFVSAPIIVTYAAMYTLMPGFENYPRQGENCSVSP